jgi:hypothetical protein
MASRDISSNIRFAESIRPAVHSAATVNGEAVDTRGFDSAACVITVGALAGSGNVTPKMQASTTGSSGWEDVPAAELEGSFPAVLTINTTYKVGYRGSRRYLRAVGTLNSGTSVTYAAAFVLSHPNQAAVA